MGSIRLLLTILLALFYLSGRVVTHLLRNSIFTLIPFNFSRKLFLLLCILSHFLLHFFFNLFLDHRSSICLDCIISFEQGILTFHRLCLGRVSNLHCLGLCQVSLSQVCTLLELLFWVRFPQLASAAFNFLWRFAHLGSICVRGLRLAGLLCCCSRCFLLPIPPCFILLPFSGLALSLLVFFLNKVFFTFHLQF